MTNPNKVYIIFCEEKIYFYDSTATENIIEAIFTDENLANKHLKRLEENEPFEDFNLKVFDVNPPIPRKKK